MGYSTRYTLTQERNPIDAEELAALIGGDEEAAYSLTPIGGMADSSKWYEHEKSLEAFSAAYPDTLFKLHGEGEESGDIWDKYFVKGKLAHEVKLKPELPAPNYDDLVPDLRRSKVRIEVPFTLVIQAFTKAEAAKKLMEKLRAAGIEIA